MGCVHLILLGQVSAEAFGQIAQGIESGLGICVHHHLPIPIPETAYDITRKQYHATRLLEHIESYPFPHQDQVLGLTQVDLFIPILTFVFGQARLNKPSAILSLCRLSPQFYGLPQNNAHTTQRATVEALHELGHTFGLPHCHHYPCAMHASRTADDIDLKSPSFCTACAQQLQRQNLSPNICT